MSTKRLNEDLVTEFSILGRKQYVGFISLSLLTVSLNALWLAYTFGYIESRSEIGLEQYGFGYQDYSILFLQLRIGIALGICTYFFWLRNTKSLIVSFLSLVWIGVEYLKWYIDSIKWLKSMGVTESSLRPVVLAQIPLVGGFYSGTR